VRSTLQVQSESETLFIHSLSADHGIRPSAAAGFIFYAFAKAKS
jgi:hypothetical protein